MRRVSMVNSEYQFIGLNQAGKFGLPFRIGQVWRFLVGPFDQSPQIQHLNPAATQFQNTVALQPFEGNGGFRTADAAAGCYLFMRGDDDGTPVGTVGQISRHARQTGTQPVLHAS